MLDEKNTIQDKEASIIDVIMANASSADTGKLSGNVPLVVEPKLITNSNFFTDNSPGGIMSKAGFLKHVYSMSTNELSAFQTLFEQMSRGEKVNAPPYQKLDPKKRHYLWISNIQPNGDLSYKVLTAENLAQLVGIYQFGLYACDLSLEGLYNEALVESDTSAG